MEPIQWNSYEKPRPTVVVALGVKSYGLSEVGKWWEVNDGVPVRRVHGEMGSRLDEIANRSSGDTQ